MESVLLVVCVILAYHFHDSIPTWVWIIAVLSALFGETGIRLRK